MRAERNCNKILGCSADQTGNSNVYWDKVKFAGVATKLLPVAALSSSHNYCSGVKCGAFRCIDGLTNDEKQNQCRTYQDKAPFLILDFGEEAQVSVEKTVLFRTVHDKEARQDHWNKTRTVEVWLADEVPTSAYNMFSEGHQLGTFEGVTTPGKEVEIRSGPGWKEKMGRYLIIQMKDQDERSRKYITLNLKEVFTFGITRVPSNGMFRGSQTTHGQG